MIETPNHTLRITRNDPPPPPQTPITEVTVTCHSGTDSSRETIHVKVNTEGLSHELRYSHRGNFALGEIYLNSDELRAFGQALIDVADQNPYARI